MNLLVSSGLEDGNKNGNGGTMKVAKPPPAGRYDLPPEAEPPHLAVFAWVCWVYSDYYGKEERGKEKEKGEQEERGEEEEKKKELGKKALIPISVISYFMKLLKSLRRAQSFYNILHNDYPTLVTVLDVIRQELQRPSSDINNKSKNNSSSDTTTTSDSPDDEKKFGCRLEPTECVETIVNFIYIKNHHDKKRQTGPRPPDRVIRSALAALEAAFHRRSDSFTTALRNRVFQHCLVILDTLSKLIQETPEMKDYDMNLKVCAAALRCITSLSYTKNLEYHTQREELAIESLPSIARCLIPIDFRYLHRDLVSAALSTATIFTRGPQRSRAYYQALYENGIFIAIRAHLLVSSYYRKWILNSTYKHVLTFIGYDLQYIQRTRSPVTFDRSMEDRYCLSTVFPNDDHTFVGRSISEYSLEEKWSKHTSAADAIQKRFKERVRPMLMSFVRLMRPFEEPQDVPASWFSRFMKELTSPPLHRIVACSQEAALASLAAAQIEYPDARTIAMVPHIPTMDDNDDDDDGKEEEEDDDGYVAHQDEVMTPTYTTSSSSSSSSSSASTTYTIMVINRSNSFFWHEDFQPGPWEDPLTWSQAWLTLCKAGFTSGTSIHMLRMYRNDSNSKRDDNIYIDQILQFATELIVNFISYKRASIDLINLFQPEFIKKMKKEAPEDPFEHPIHFVPFWQKTAMEALGLDFRALYTVFYELFPQIKLPQWLANQASLEPFPTIEDAYHHLTWNSPGLTAYWKIHGKRYEVYFDTSWSENLFRPRQLQQILVRNKDSHWTCPKQHLLEEGLESKDLNDLGTMLLKALGRAQGEDTADEDNLECAGHPLFDTSFRGTVFSLVQNLIFRIEGVKYVQWDLCDKLWQVDMEPSHPIPEILKGDPKIVRAAPWVASEWKPSSALEVSCEKSKATLSFLARLRPNNDGDAGDQQQQQSDSTMVAITAAHLFFKDKTRPALNGSMVKSKLATCQIGTVKHTLTLHENFTSLQTPGTVSILLLSDFSSIHPSHAHLL